MKSFSLALTTFLVKSQEERANTSTQGYATAWSGPSADGYSQSGSYTVYPAGNGQHLIEVEMVLNTPANLGLEFLY